MSEWISIKDKLPKYREPVLVTNGKIVTACSLDYMGDIPWYWDAVAVGGHDWEMEFSENFHDGEITHWMPLPNPPINQQATEKE